MLVSAYAVGHPYGGEIVDAARRAALVEDPRLQRVLAAGDGARHPLRRARAGPGRTLAELLQNGPLAAETGRRLAGEAAEALDRAATRGLHHLRLRPTSLIVARDGTVTVAGTAIDAAADGIESPTSAAAARSDAAGLVALLYAALTGRWPGTQEAGLARAPRVAGRPVPPGDLVAGCPQRPRHALLGHARARTTTARAVPASWPRSSRPGPRGPAHRPARAAHRRSRPALPPCPPHLAALAMAARPHGGGRAEDRPLAGSSAAHRRREHTPAGPRRRHGRAGAGDPPRTPQRRHRSKHRRRATGGRRRPPSSCGASCGRRWAASHGRRRHPARGHSAPPGRRSRTPRRPWARPCPAAHRPPPRPVAAATRPRAARTSRGIAPQPPSAAAPPQRTPGSSSSGSRTSGSDRPGARLRGGGDGSVRGPRRPPPARGRPRTPGTTRRPSGPARRGPAGRSRRAAPRAAPHEPHPAAGRRASDDPRRHGARRGADALDILVRSRTPTSPRCRPAATGADPAALSIRLVARARVLLVVLGVFAVTRIRRLPPGPADQQGWGRPSTPGAGASGPHRRRPPPPRPRPR